MNKPCAKCSKTVYPTEEVRCLDQSFHKFCFKCDTCGMTLNMKNYKGYNRKPYCNTHYPQTRFTAIADTPENKRIAENTKIQSNVNYHAEFEKLKGKKTSVIHDPETDRIRQNTAIQSQIQYQNVAAKKHEMEARRPEQVMDGRRGRTNPGKISEYEPPASQTPPPPQSYSHQPPRNSADVGYSAAAMEQHAAKVYDSEVGDVQNGQRRRQPGSISDYDPMASYGQQKQNFQAPAPPPAGYGKPRGLPSYRAIYDYQAGDDDEVSFREGDVVFDCEIIDEGWMVGTVKNSNQRGMLPSNYVEPI